MADLTQRELSLDCDLRRLALIRERHCQRTVQRGSLPRLPHEIPEVESETDTNRADISEVSAVSSEHAKAAVSAYFQKKTVDWKQQ